MQGQIPSLLLIIILIFWFNVARIRISKKAARKKEGFWEKEQEANRTRKQSLDTLDYIYLPLKELPFMETDDDTLNEIQDEIRRISEKKIVNLTGFSNTDLKLKYGAPNLDTLTQYDENFTTLARLLYRWGTRLHELCFDKEAVFILELGISYATDIRAHYVLLANLYIREGRKSDIQNLISRAAELNSLNKNPIIRSLQELLN